MQPAEGEPFGVVFGSFGSAGNEQHILWRRLTIKHTGIQGGSFNPDIAQVSYMTGMFGGLYSVTPQVTFPLIPGASDAKSSSFVFRVRPGEYVLSGLRIELHMGTRPTLAGSRANWSGWADLEIPFSVVPGKPVYLGELLSAVGVREGKSAVYFLATDKLERDLGLLRQSGVELELSKVVNAAPRVAAANHLSISPMLLER